MKLDFETRLHELVEALAAAGHYVAAAHAQAAADIVADFDPLCVSASDVEPIDF